MECPLTEVLYIRRGHLVKFSLCRLLSGHRAGSPAFVTHVSQVLRGQSLLACRGAGKCACAILDLHVLLLFSA